MNKTKIDSRTSWQFRLEDFSNATCKGVRLAGARKASRGPWLRGESVPAYVRDYFLPAVRDGITFVAEYSDIAALVTEVGTPDAASSESDRIHWQKQGAGFAHGVVSIQVPALSQQAQRDSIPKLEGFTRGDGTKWGVSDFYEDKEATLRAALDSGKDFSTGWFGSKKEIASGCVTRIGKDILCEASCSDDFDTEGNGSATVKIGKKSGDRLLAAIQAALDHALAEAQADRRLNSPVQLWAVYNQHGSWVETYLAPAGIDCADDGPPGDNYAKWFWQGEAKIPVAVKKAFEERSQSGGEFTSGGYTFKLCDE